MLPLPASPYEACGKISARVGWQSLLRYRPNDYSVPTEYGHRQEWVKGKAVVFDCCTTLRCSSRRREYSIGLPETTERTCQAK
jgi:hypothetical protein